MSSLFFSLSISSPIVHFESHRLLLCFCFSVCCYFISIWFLSNTKMPITCSRYNLQKPFVFELVVVLLASWRVVVLSVGENVFVWCRYIIFITSFLSFGLVAFGLCGFSWILPSITMANKRKYLSLVHRLSCCQNFLLCGLISHTLSSHFDRATPIQRHQSKRLE